MLDTLDDEGDEKGVQIPLQSPYDNLSRRHR